MKLHLPSRLLAAVLTACAASVSYTVAADVTWNADGTKYVTSTAQLELPTDGGSLYKTSTGNIIVTLGDINGDGTYDDKDAQTQEKADTLSARTDFTGNIYVNAGTLQYGATSVNTINDQWQNISINALGNSGNVYVADKATLAFSVSQKGTSNYARQIVLQGGTLKVVDGNYNFTGGLKLEADSTLRLDWGKTIGISGLSAEGKKLTIDQGNEKSTVTFSGNFKVDELAVDADVTINVGTENNVVSNFAMNTLTIGAGSTVNLAAGGATKQSISSVSLGAGSTYNMVDGNFEYTTLTLSGNATMKQGYNKNVNIATAVGEGHTLTYSLNNRYWGNSTLNFITALNLGGLTLQTADTDANRKNRLVANIEAENAAIGTLTAKQYTTANINATGVSVTTASVEAGGIVNLAADKTATIGSLTLAEGASFSNAGQLTLTGTVTLAEGASFSNAGQLTLTGMVTLDELLSNRGTITFGSAATINLATWRHEITHANNTYTYRLVTEDSTGTVDLSALTPDSLTGIDAEGKQWDFSATDGTFSYTTTGAHFTSTDRTLSWVVGAEMDNDATYTDGGSVTFSGTNTVTLGGNISANVIDVNEQATVSIDAAGYTLTAHGVNIYDSGTLELSGTEKFHVSNIYVDAGGTLTLTGKNLASGFAVHGLGSIVLNPGVGADAVEFDNQISGFEGEVVIQSGTYKTTATSALASVTALTVTQNGSVEFFDKGSSFTGTINLSVAEGNRKAIQLNGSSANGTINVDGHASIWNVWNGTLNAQLIGEGNVEIGGEQNFTITINSTVGSTLVGDVIVDKTGGATNFTGTCTLANTGQFIVKNGNVSVAKNIQSSGGIVVHDGATLTVTTDQSGDFTLKGGTLNFSSCTPMSSATITLADTEAGEISTSTISGNNTSLYAGVSGEGNLVLKQASLAFNIASTLNFTGNLSLASGTINLGTWNGTAPMVSNAGDINVDGATVNIKNTNGANQSTISNTGDININSGSFYAENKTTISRNGDAAINLRGGTFSTENSDITIARDLHVQVADGDSYKDVMVIAGKGNGNTTYTDVSITQTALTRRGENTASLANADITVTGDYSITGVKITGSTIKVSNGTLTLDTSVLEDTTLNVAQDAQLAVGENASVTMGSGSVSVALSDDGGLAASVGSSATYDSATYTLVSTEQLAGLKRAQNAVIELGLTGEIVNMLESGTNVALEFENFVLETTNTRQIALLTGETYGFSLADGVTCGTIVGVEQIEKNTLVYINSAYTPAGSIPEPTTATLSLLALAALAARRRRK